MGQSAVKADKLLNLEMPLPPLNEQQRIAGLLRERMAAIETVRAAAEAELEAINGLSGSSLHRAFPGEL